MNIETNGHGAGGAALLRCIDLTPQTMPAFVDTAGRVYEGYARGQRCPRGVSMEYQAAFDRWQMEDATAREAGLPRSVVAWHGFLDTVLLALVPDLSPEMASMIQEIDALEILRTLDWIGAADAPAEPDPNTHAEGVTGARSSPRKGASPRRSASTSTVSGG